MVSEQSQLHQTSISRENWRYFAAWSGLSHLSSHKEEQRRLLLLGFVLGHKLLCYRLNELFGWLQFAFLLGI